MAEHINHLGQPIGFPLPGWTARPRPPRTAMVGQWCTVEMIDPARHAADLFAAYALDKEGRNWTYLPYGPFAAFEDFRAWLEQDSRGDDPLRHVIIEHRSGRAAGVASLMRIDPAAGVIEVGGIHYAPPLQRTPAATEAMYLMMRRVFDELGYRRYEWKCDALNAASQRAALRFGFVFEGVFRNHMIVKGRSRDTAWFAMTDAGWPARKAAFEQWLDPANFDTEGRQKVRLSELTAPLRARR
jgi:RimJ/RimL family protein N-acetyltransferase